MVITPIEENYGRNTRRFSLFLGGSY
jgi:hypothetical protein